VPDAAAAELEGVTGGERRQSESRGLEGAEAQRPAHQPREERSGPRDQRAAPRPEDDHRGDVDPRGDAEDAGPERLADACVLGLLEQLRGQRRRTEQRERGQWLAGSRQPTGDANADAGRGGQVREQREPH
jgi:hypothetical protein